MSPDGRWIAARPADGRWTLYPVEAGEPRAINGLSPEDRVIRWSQDGLYLYTYRFGELPARVFRVGVPGGEWQLWKTISIEDPAGVAGVLRLLLSADARSYVVEYDSFLSDLYLVKGLTTPR